MVDDALDVASVTASAAAVDLIAVHHVVAGIAVGEAVGHDQVEHVGRTETHRAGFRVARPQFVGYALPLREGEVQGSGLRGAVDVEIHEKIVGVLDLADLLDPDPLIVREAHGRFGDVFAVEHYLKLVVLHSGVPERRFDPLHLSRSEKQRHAEQRAQGGKGFTCHKAVI